MTAMFFQAEKPSKCDSRNCESGRKNPEFEQMRTTFMPVHERKRWQKEALA